MHWGVGKFAHRNPFVQCARRGSLFYGKVVLNLSPCHVSPVCTCCSMSNTGQFLQMASAGVSTILYVLAPFTHPIHTCTGFILSTPIKSATRRVSAHAPGVLDFCWNPVIKLKGSRPHVENSAHKKGSGMHSRSLSFNLSLCAYASLSAQRASASSSATTVTLVCSCRIEAGHLGVTGPKHMS